MPGACAKGTFARNAVSIVPMPADTQVAIITASAFMPVCER